MEAAMNNHIAILSVQQENGADQNKINCLGRTAQVEAAVRGHPAITLRLCQAHPDINYCNKQHPQHLNALMEAASRGHDGVVFWQCEARANIDAINLWGDTALIMAASNDRQGCVKILVAHRANIHIRGDGGLTAKEIACVQGHIEIADFLSQKNINDEAYLEELYLQFKNEQKKVLQDEVNYDASVSSRKIPPLSSIPQSVEWLLQEYLEYIPFSYDKDMKVIYKSLQQSFNLINQMDIVQYIEPTDNSNDITTVPINKNKLTQSLTKRLLPLNNVPNFHKCTWIAIDPTRTVQQSRSNRIYQMNNILEKQSKNITTNDTTQSSANSNDVTNSYPVLELYDNGTWKYYEDILSGNLSGVYEMYRVKTVPSEKMIEYVYQNLNPTDISSSQCAGKYFYYIRLITYVFLVSFFIFLFFYFFIIFNFYLFILILFFFFMYRSPNEHGNSDTEDGGGGEVDNDRYPATDGDSINEQQVVGFILGKQIVLGHLVMEMADDETPWWIPSCVIKG